MPHSVDFNLLDKPRQLRFDVNAIAGVEEAMNCNIGVLFKEDRVGFSVLRALLCYGLRWQDRALTVEKVGTLMQNAFEGGVTIEQLMEPISKAIEAAGIFPKTAEPKEGGDPDPLQ